ncbi:MAG: ferrous iron transport protein B [Planctomycetaceae bacterium]|nr:ferrous iron transport protein B [Planctomycetaceae bacterium]
MQGMLRRFGRGRKAGTMPSAGEALGKILIVGSPNVGKSALFNRLTGQYVTVSNYPGTTVEICRGRSSILQRHFEVVDTPGIYSLCPITDEERVACRLVLTERAAAVVHVVDAKNIRRMLGLTLQLIEANLPVVLALNMADEARQLRIAIDADRLSTILGIPVVETIAISGGGMAELAAAIESVAQTKREAAGGEPVDYGAALERAVNTVAPTLGDDHGISRRTRALLLLQEDPAEASRVLGRRSPEHTDAVLQALHDARALLEHSPHYYATLALRGRSDRILDAAVCFPPRGRHSFRETLSRLCMHPLTGLPLLAAVLYFGLYVFVGKFGAGTMVDFIQETVFGRYVTPYVEQAVNALLPWPVWRDLFVGDYGIVTLGIRYAVAIVLPIVATFFIAFSILEDSGYLPRLAMLIDRVFKKIGLNGRAVIPIVLGFGCDTMATMVTRTLETKREKVIASLLLALAIPCSAQLGVIMGLLAGRPWALAVWAAFVTGVFLLTGFLAARLLPGQRPSFYMELPPLRLPRVGNVLVKTYSRMVWYFKEVLPLFILASVLIWLGKLTGVFDLAVDALKPVVGAIGLPDGAAKAFLFGFFRRDYGAAGLYELQKTAAMSGRQLVVAAITLTLFLPCIAQLLILKKERGWKMALTTSIGICVVALAVGWSANALLTVLKVTL